jgi:hypothetical protein
MSVRAPLIAACALLLVSSAAQAGKKDKETGGGDINSDQYKSPVTEQELPAEGLIKQEVDLDVDGKPEIINYYRPRSSDRLLVKKELDLNRDGRMDLISTFDDDGKLKKEEMDSDYDGNIDWIDHYREGRRVMAEYDTETDGKSNVYKYYETVETSTNLSRKERDTDGDGKIDVWERFGPNGQVIRTGKDTDGDGKMDEREE